MAIWTSEKDGDALGTAGFGFVQIAPCAPALRVSVGGADVPVLFAGAQGQYSGLDQINIGPLPRTLVGRGEVDVLLTCADQQANPLRVSFK
ncbi:MAG TPA: hypothetical protein VFA33_21530 [Bryobacteraceae bacterium]|nr:hypothetical protein [Bryobacteraceae bacterium]